MDNFFLLIFLLTPFLWVFAMIRPRSFARLQKYSSRKWLTAFSVLLFLFSFVGFGLTTDLETEPTIVSSPAPEPTVLGEMQENIDTVKVSYVVDGDTIEIEGGQRVRLIGIDTPETVDPTRPAGCYGKEASEFTKASLEGKEVRLEKDISETDRFGRILRYVYINDELFNETLVREGYAQASTYQPDVKYQEKFTEAQRVAKELGKGLWSDVCLSTPKATATPKAVVSAQPQPISIGNCKYECNGLDRDCSDFSSHAEAQTFFNCCGFSAGNDPMRLDKANGQGDGIACESL